MKERYRTLDANAFIHDKENSIQDTFAPIWICMMGCHARLIRSKW